jgi:hypothetical protein
MATRDAAGAALRDPALEGRKQAQADGRPDGAPAPPSRAARKVSEPAAAARPDVFASLHAVLPVSNEILARWPQCLGLRTDRATRDDVRQLSELAYASRVGR